MRNTFDAAFTHSQITIFNSGMGGAASMWRDEHVAQGFVWRPTAVSFATLNEGGSMHVEFELADRLPRVSPSSVRAIRVPFTVTEPGKVEIGFWTTSVFEVPPGQYDLLYEAGGDFEADQWCRFTLATASGDPAAILRQDVGLTPPPTLYMEYSGGTLRRVPVSSFSNLHVRLVGTGR